MLDTRYQVGCACCGLLETYGTRKAALRAAQYRSANHEAVQVFDVLAHRGRPQLWAASGEINAYRTAHP